MAAAVAPGLSAGGGAATDEGLSSPAPGSVEETDAMLGRDGPRGGRPPPPPPLPAPAAAALPSCDASTMSLRYHATRKPASAAGGPRRVACRTSPSLYRPGAVQTRTRLSQYLLWACGRRVARTEGTLRSTADTTSGCSAHLSPGPTAGLHSTPSRCPTSSGVRV
jgi:hypothetical protein